MKLMTRKIEDLFRKYGKQSGVRDPIVVVKFFNPMGRGTWYATSYDPEDRVFHGYVSIWGDHNDEWGNFSLDELESVSLPFGLGIERDLYFTPRPISEVCPRAYELINDGGFIEDPKGGVLFALVVPEEIG